MAFTGFFNGVKAWIIPQEKKFFVLFDKHAAVMADAAQALVEMFEKFDDLKGRRDAIKAIENRGDDLVKEVYEISNFSFITPLDHEDIVALTQAVDDVTDFIYAVSNKVFLYKVSKPTPEMKEFASLISKGVNQLVPSINNVRKLKPEVAEKLYEEVNTLEKKGDEILNEAIAALLEEKDAKEIIRYKEIYEHLEEVTDMIHNVSCVLLDISIKYS